METSDWIVEQNKRNLFTLLRLTLRLRFKVLLCGVFVYYFVFKVTRHGLLNHYDL